MTPTVFYHPLYSALPLPEHHRFPLAKYQALHQSLQSLPLRWQQANPISREALTRIHEPTYVDALLQGSLDPLSLRRIGFPWSPLLLERTRLSVGATVMAARHACEEGCALQISGGYHHAHRERGSGFCLFNDLVLAGDLMIAEGRAERVLICDLDVHQGDGSATLCQGRDDIITLSLHAERNFPGNKAHSHLDFPLPDGMQDDAYLETLSQALELALRLYAPDLILYQAGIDVHREDELGYLALSDEGVRQRDRFVFDTAQTRGIAIAAVPGGGYRRDWSALVPLHRILFEEALACCLR
ncbi:histone deacetylase family protein [Aeromonas schubertii]|uniref:histone deacetylase family protein n=1 Tax=Aeromonas schubertii TaxID=652 RepID=UPI0010A7D1C0|nr:histone deacetylase [Aeromonas schubertii]QCG50014.1 histone deacetylase [Aeromonas schubertii]